MRRFIRQATQTCRRYHRPIDSPEQLGSNRCVSNFGSSSQIDPDQYQSTMDVLYSMPHDRVMKSVEDGSGNERPLLSVVDDDESIRESVPDLIKEFGYAARAFSSAEEFLSSGSVDQTSCLILDIAMPGLSGPELYQELKRRGENIPVIFITGQKDERVRARALEQGAAGFLIKPFSDAALLAAIKAALKAI
jgi:CheY-like chemotaxis protein